VVSVSLSTASSRSESDAAQKMGKACFNVVERASLGAMSCPVSFDNHVVSEPVELLICSMAAFWLPFLR
jgi:hypothetical protein